MNWWKRKKDLDNAGCFLIYSFLDDGFYEIYKTIEDGTCKKWNRYNVNELSVWYECSKGYKYKDINDYRDQQLKKLGI